MTARLWEWAKAIDSSTLGLPEWDRELRQLRATFNMRRGRIQVGIDADSEYRVFGWSLDWRGGKTPKTAVEATFKTPAEMLAWLHEQKAVPYRTWLSELKVDDTVVVVEPLPAGQPMSGAYQVGAVLKHSVRVGAWKFSKRTGAVLGLAGQTLWIERAK